MAHSHHGFGFGRFRQFQALCPVSQPLSMAWRRVFLIASASPESCQSSHWALIAARSADLFQPSQVRPRLMAASCPTNSGWSESFGPVGGSGISRMSK